MRLTEVSGSQTDAVDDLRTLHLDVLQPLGRPLLADLVQDLILLPLYRASGLLVPRRDGVCGEALGPLGGRPVGVQASLASRECKPL